MDLLRIFGKGFDQFFNKSLNDEERNQILRIGLKIFVCLQNSSINKLKSELSLLQQKSIVSCSKIDKIFTKELSKFDLNPRDIPFFAESILSPNLKIEFLVFMLESIVPFVHNSSFLPNFYEITQSPPKSSITYRKNIVKHQKGSFFTPSWLVREIISTIKTYWLKYNHQTRTKINVKMKEELEMGQEIHIKIADIACGAGNFIQFIPEYLPHSEILAFDSDPLALEIARINFTIFSVVRGEKSSFNKDQSCTLKKKDSLKYFFQESPFDILIGNPPWGTDVKPYQKLLQTKFKVLLQSSLSQKSPYNHPYKIRDQIDIYALFIIRNLELVQIEGMVALILPSTILFNPVYAPLRYHLLTKTTILQINYLGEKIFTNVNVPSCILFLQKKKPSQSHLIKILLFNEQLYLNREKLEMFNMNRWNIHSVSQQSFIEHSFYNFIIFTRRSNVEIIKNIESTEHYVFGDFVNNSRGVELGKNGEIYQCPACKKWNPIPHFKKDPQKSPVLWTKCPHCKKNVEKSQISNFDRIILPVDSFEKRQDKVWASILIGEDVQRFSLKNRFNILLNYNGIKYKSPEKYNTPKILIRKTGNGIISAMDYKKNYTVQVIYQFSLKYDIPHDTRLMSHIISKIKSDVPNIKEVAQKSSGLSDFIKDPDEILENYDLTAKSKKINTLDYNARILSQYSLEFLFGIISSKVIENYYLHNFTNPNKKTFPHLIQANILALPIPKIDFSNKKSLSFHLYQEICNYVDEINQDGEIESIENNVKIENIRKINQNVAKLFNIPLSDLNLEN